MTKIFNNRPLFYCFLAFGLGIYFAKPIFSLDVGTIIFAVLCFGVLAFLLVKYRKLKRLICIVCCFAIGVGTFFISLSAYTCPDFGKDEHIVSGRVAISTIYESSQRVLVDNVYIDGNKIGENISVFIYDSNDIEEGHIITFESTISKHGLFTLGNFNSYNYKYNVPYSTTINAEDITIDKIDVLQWSERLKLSIKSVLFNNMGVSEASVSYASLFGDKTYIPSETKESFSVTGIAHLLAVSGLHVGFVVAVLSYILKKLKVNKYVNICILASLLGVYCYLCSFSASVVRASLMFLILDFAFLIGKRYDKLNAWSFAGIICLLYRPLSVYDGGFLLSFACVLCILMFARPLQDKLTKWHLPKWLAGSLGVMIPIQFGLLPLLSQYFTRVSLLSLITNLVCVPVFEIFFILLFIFVPIVLLIPAFVGILHLPEFIIGCIIKFADFIADIDFAVIKLTAFISVVVIGFYCVMFICSHFVNVKKKFKLIATFSIIFVVFLISTISTIKVAPSNNKIGVLNVYGNSVYSLEIDGVSFAVGEFDKNSIKHMEEFASFSRLYEYDYFISLNSGVPSNNEIFKNVYSYNNGAFENNLNKLNNINLDGVMLEVANIGNEFMGLIFYGKDVKIFVCANKQFNYGEFVQFVYTYGNFDLVIGKEKYLSEYYDYINCNYLVLDGKQILNNQKLIKNDYVGNWTFNLSNSKIYNIRGVD